MIHICSVYTLLVVPHQQAERSEGVLLEPVRGGHHPALVPTVPVPLETQMQTQSFPIAGHNESVSCSPQCESHTSAILCHC